MKRFLWLTPALALLVSCLVSCSSSRQQGDVEEYYDLSKAEPGELTDVFSDVELTPLLFEGEYYPRQVWTLHYHDSLIMVQDNKEGIYVFDADGHYRSSSEQVYGQGPREFYYLYAYSLNPYTGLIQVLTFDKIMCYDADFNFVEERPLPMRIDPTGQESMIFTSIYDLSGHNHLLTTLQSSIIKDAYIHFDSNTGELGDTINYSPYVIALGFTQGNRIFNLSDGTTLAKPPFIGEYIFSLDADSLKLTPVIKFDMGSESITHDEYLANSDERNIYAFEEYVESVGKTVIDGANPTKDKIFFTTHQGRKVNRIKVLVADRKTGEIKTFNYWDDDEYFFPPLLDFDDEYLYSGVSKYELLESPALLLGKDLDLDSLLADYDEDTLIMLRYKIK